MEKSIHSHQYRVFLDVLRKARRRAGLTQVELAKKVGEEQSFVSKCERGERRIDVVELRAFCQAFCTISPPILNEWFRGPDPDDAKRLRRRSCPAVPDPPPPRVALGCHAAGIQMDV
jgi:transcriptional regulator with XRE-family HTH domain